MIKKSICVLFYFLGIATEGRKGVETFFFLHARPRPPLYEHLYPTHHIPVWLKDEY